MLTILNLKAENLKNTELIGKADPYARVSFGDWNEATPTLTNAGSNPSWPNLNLQAEVNRSMLTSQSLRIEFREQNGLASDVSLGHAVVSIRSLCQRLAQPVTIPFQITNVSGAITGKGEISAMLARGDASQLSEALPESAVVVEKGNFRIVRIVAEDLGGGSQSILDSKPVSLLFSRILPS